MGQVPNKNVSHFLLIGSGRLAKHLQFYFSDLGLSYSTWNRSQPNEILHALLPAATHVLLAISDHSLISFYEEHLTSTSAKVVHFSGRLHDARMLSAHPLMSFSHSLFAAEAYRQIHFTICGAHDLGEVLPGLPNSFSEIQPEQKPMYHALCVFAGNFSNLLWKTSWNELKNLGLPSSALQTYLQQTLNNFSQDPQHSLTGPFVRRDYETIESNLNALPHAMADVYLAFLKLYSKDLHQQLVTEKGSHL